MWLLAAAAITMGACGAGGTDADATASTELGGTISESTVPVATASTADVAEAATDSGAPIELPRADDGEPDSGRVDDLAAGDGSDTMVGGEISNDGVLAAAVIVMTDGDLEGAIADGIITEAEAEAALTAIEQGNLDHYAR